ncbi:MAG: serine/threonine protein phosphatase, partial [Pseudomonadota bacterium]
PEGRALELWFMNGGEAAVASFGIDPWDALRSGAERGRTRLRDALASAMPVASRAFMEAMPLTLRFGDFLFVHAGIRPGVALEAQDADDLIWIRGAFLEDDTEHPAVIVHGHTPTRFVELRPNRIGIDTGAGKGGPLSAIIIEGSSVALLSKNGPVPLPPPG